MAKVGIPREPRLPTGPKPNDIESHNLLMMDEAVITDRIAPPVVKVEEKKGENENFKEVETIRTKIPTAPSKRIDYSESKQFYDWTKCFTDESIKVQILWYMYRTMPRISRTDQKYIDCSNIAITEQWILETHGSGDYMFIVNDQTKGKGNNLCTAFCRVDNPIYPPILNIAELDVHFKGNEPYVTRLISEGKLTTDRKPMNQPQNGGGTQLSDQIILKLIDKLDQKQINNMKDPKDSAIEAAFNIIGKGNEAATKLMLDQMKQDDPDKLFKLVELIMKMIPKPPEHKDNTDGNMMKFLEIMNKKDETIMNLMTKMMDKQIAVQAGPSEGDVFDKSLDRMTKLMELTGIGEGGGKKSTLETVMQYGMPVLQNVFGMIQNLMALKAQGAPQIDPKTGKPVPTSTVPVVVSNAPPITAGAEDEQVIEGQPTIEGKKTVEQAMMMNSEQQKQAISNGLKQMGPRIIDAIQRGVPGDAFAESIEGFLGPIVYNQLASLGVDNIIEIVKTDQQLWSQLAPVENLFVEFVKEFVAYGEPGVEGDVIK